MMLRIGAQRHRAVQRNNIHYKKCGQGPTYIHRNHSIARHNGAIGRKFDTLHERIMSFNGVLLR